MDCGGGGSGAGGENVPTGEIGEYAAVLLSVGDTVDDAVCCRRRGSFEPADADDDGFFLPYVRTLSLIGVGRAAVSFKLRSIGVCDGIVKRVPNLLLTLSLSKNDCSSLSLLQLSENV